MARRIIFGSDAQRGKLARVRALTPTTKEQLHAIRLHLRHLRQLYQAAKSNQGLAAHRVDSVVLLPYSGAHLLNLASDYENPCMSCVRGGVARAAEHSSRAKARCRAFV